jgi:hypothetical protein
MPQPARHIIRNASLNFRYTGKTDGMALHQEVADWCRDVLGPSLDSILAEYDQTEEMIYLDHISLDIGLERAEDWKKDLAEKINRRLTEEIHLKISSKGADVLVKSKSASFSESLLYYLKYGFLPWYSNMKSVDDFNTGLQDWVKNVPQPEIKNLFLNLPDDKSFRRLVAILSRQDFEILLSAAMNEATGKVAFVFKDAEVISGFFTKDKNLQQSLLKDFRERLAAGYVVRQPAGLLQVIFKEWVYSLTEKYKQPLAKIDLKALINPEIQNIIRDAQQDVIIKLKQKQKNIAQKKNPAEIENEKLSAEIKTALDKELGEGIFIGNAGTVIIAPFLTSLFSRAGLLKDDKITDGSTAVSLIYYCISGQKNPAEFELLLPRILCGINPETFIEITPMIDQVILKEADEMLASVIEHWSVLKDTSVKGLREAFLQRDGKLVFSDNEWLLIVEQKPYDMLLEQLPWNIGMIKLPWMKNILRTQWI